MKSREEIFAEFIDKNVLINETNEDDLIPSGQIIELSEEDLKNLDKAHEDLFEYQLFQRKITEVRLNLSSYFEAIILLEEKLKKAPRSQRMAIQKDSFVNLNRHLTNFTASFKSLIYDFLEEHRLPKIYGKNSEEVNKFTRKTNEWYNTNMSYRFLMKLRDFAIHYDFPIHSLGFDYDLNKHSEDVIEKVNCNVKFCKSHLLSNSKFRKQIIKQDLSSYNHEFPVNPILNGVQSIIDEIMPFLIDLSNGRYKESADLIISYYAKFKNPKYVSYGLVKKDLGLNSKILENEIANEIKKY